MLMSKKLFELSIPLYIKQFKMINNPIIQGTFKTYLVMQQK